MVIQALSLSADQKMGHYMHISPFFMFLAQMIGTFLGAVFNLATAFWAETGLADQLLNDPAWNPTGFNTFLNAGGIWGAIGPARFFGPESPYFSLMLGFLIGLILPAIPFVLNRMFPNPNWKYINVPLMVQQNATGGNQAFIIVSWALNWFFNRFMFKNSREWWEKYNFILGIALDSSTAIALLVITSIQFIGPDWESSGLSPLAPTVPDYYCTERFFNGSSIHGL